MAATAPNAFVKQARRVYHPLGFRKGYNAVLYLIGAGALFGFTMARFSFLNFNNLCPGSGTGGTAPGECYWYNNFSRYKIGILLHLATIFPAGLLAIVQFLPVVRRRFVLYHRMAGYVAILLSIVSMAGVFMIAQRAFGGGLSTQAAVGTVALAFLGSLVLAVVNIRRKQIEQHRAWMLRAWWIAGSIITVRIIMITSAGLSSLYSAQDGMWVAYDCHQLRYVIKNDALLASTYPSCAPILDAATAATSAAYYAAVQVSMKLRVENISAALQSGFSTGLWLALIIHVLGVELYLRLTPREAERLRHLSYQRQLEAGLKHPGNAGLVGERLGDAELWVPEFEAATSEKPSAPAPSSPSKTFSPEATRLARPEPSSAPLGSDAEAARHT